MSGYQRPRNHSALSVHLPRLPGNFPGADVINGAFTLLEAADAQNIKRNIEAAFPAILLQAPNGSTYRVSVDDTGALVLVQVPTR